MASSPRDNTTAILLALDDDDARREGIASRGHQAFRETFEESFGPVASFDEEQAPA